MSLTPRSFRLQEPLFKLNDLYLLLRQSQYGPLLLKQRVSFELQVSTVSIYVAQKYLVP